MWLVSVNSSLIHYKEHTFSTFNELKVPAEWSSQLIFSPIEYIQILYANSDKDSCNRELQNNRIN